jgi:nicotinate-nucleotide adenylyltransferase
LTELAIYGGTFAPVHNGHVQAVNAFLETVKPDRLLIIPTLIPPHKQIDFDDNPTDRLEMLRLAFSSHPLYEKTVFISDYELNSPPPSYTYNTLKNFSSKDVHITFLCGTDMFLTLDSWYRADDIFKMCTVALMLRESKTPELLEKIQSKQHYLTEKYGADIIVIDMPPVEISSSEIRSGGDSIRKEYLPCPVYKYIKENGLYCS